MGFGWDDVASIGGNMGTLGLYQAYKGLTGGYGGGGGGRSYAALPFENPDNPVDSSRVAEALKQGLGRAPTQNEIDQYSKYIKTGDLDYGEIGQIAQGLPEADRARLDQYATQFGDKLNAQNKEIIDMAGASANSRFASLGRPNTSALGASVMQAGGALAQARQSALANFYGQGLQDNMGSYRNQGNAAMSRAYGLTDKRTDYNRSLLGYQTQRSDYGADLYNQEMKNKRQAFNQLAGSLAGAGVGGAMGGVGGARLGAGIGGQAGGLF